MEKQIEQATDRIKNMESVFDFLQNMVKKYSVSVCKQDWFKAQLNNLLDYYENGNWQADYTLDEQGMIPHNLKRGVLSQDGVYNFISDLNDHF